MTDEITLDNATDDVTTELTTLEQQVAQLPNVQYAAEDISAELAYLHETGADARALNTIHNGAADLFDASQQLSTAFSTAMGLAQRIRQQRDAANKALTDLKQAMADLDFGVPEIEMLVEAAEEMFVETSEIWMLDMAGELLVDNILMYSPLDFTEASQLADALLGEVIPGDHPLWDDLRQWIARAQEVGRE